VSRVWWIKVLPCVFVLICSSVCGHGKRKSRCLVCKRVKAEGGPEEEARKNARLLAREDRQYAPMWKSEDIWGPPVVEEEITIETISTAY
jgi:hypothetical protein